jgi:hypothetical protein
VYITKTVAQKVSNYVECATDGQFMLGDITNPGDGGPHYLDSRSSILSWTGPRAASHACAYYLGALSEYLRVAGYRLDDYAPIFIRAVQDEIHGRGPGVASTFNDGRNAARLKIEAGPRDEKNGRPLCRDGCTLFQDSCSGCDYRYSDDRFIDPF